MSESGVTFTCAPWNRIALWNWRTPW